MGQLKCVICGESAVKPNGSCKWCHTSKEMPYAIWDFAVFGVEADDDEWNDEGVTYTRHNWHNHPSVVARRQEVGGRVDMTSKWPGPLQMPMSPYAPGSAREYAPSLVEKAAQCGFTESMMEHVESLIGVPEEKPTAKYFQQVGRVHRGPPVLSGIINDLIKKGNLAKPHVILFKDEVEKLPSLMQPRAKHETTHTFSAELPDGSVVTMPSPGDDWVAGETVEYKRGDMCVDDTDYDDLEWMKHHALVGNSRDRVINFSTDLQKCWFKEFVSRLYYGTPILSITTWARTVPPPAALPEPYDYYCPSRENTVGLEIWPETRETP